MLYLHKRNYITITFRYDIRIVLVSGSPGPVPLTAVTFLDEKTVIRLLFLPSFLGTLIRTPTYIQLSPREETLKFVTCWRKIICF